MRFIFYTIFWTAIVICCIAALFHASSGRGPIGKFLNYVGIYHTEEHALPTLERYQEGKLRARTLKEASEERLKLLQERLRLQSEADQVNIRVHQSVQEMLEGLRSDMEAMDSKGLTRGLGAPIDHWYRQEEALWRMRTFDRSLQASGGSDAVQQVQDLVEATQHLQDQLEDIHSKIPGTAAYQEGPVVERLQQDAEKYRDLSAKIALQQEKIDKLTDKSAGTVSQDQSSTIAAQQDKIDRLNEKASGTSSVGSKSSDAAAAVSARVEAQQARLEDLMDAAKARSAK